MHTRIKNEHILRSVPLLASVLGDRYGVQVRIGGTAARTDGNTIYLPSLPMECDDVFLNTLRGMLDHEAGHVRYTDFAALNAAKFGSFEKFVWNCLEDWRVEHKMAAHFSGCRVNFDWLIHHVFHAKPKRAQMPLQDAVAEWLLLTIRSWDVPNLQRQVNALAKRIHADCPELLQELGALLLEVRSQCESSQDVFIYARRIVDCIQNYTNKLEDASKTSSPNSNEQIRGKTKDHENDLPTKTAPTVGGTEDEKEGNQDTNQNTNQGTIQDGGNTENDQDSTCNQSTKTSQTGDKIQNVVTSLQSLLAQDGQTSDDADASVTSSLPTLIGEKAQALIEKGRGRNSQQISVAIAGHKVCTPLSAENEQAVQRVSRSLKARLQGMLQAQRLVRSCPSSKGRVNYQRLHGLATQNRKIFLQQHEQKATNTAIHLLLDTSGSMREKMEQACHTCYALASALKHTQGINLAVTSFPALVPLKAPKSNEGQNATITRNTGPRPVYVYPILKHGEAVHSNFAMQAMGGTPLTEALWWTYTQLLAQKEQRKILLLITDGEPDERETALNALAYATKIGIEVYGIGLPPCHIQDILPHNSITLDHMDHLPQAMFGLLQTTLTHKA